MEWVRGKTIGHGSFAAVSVAKSVNSDSPKVLAVKSCGVSHCESLKRERIILEELNECPNIIKCYGDSVTVENGVRLYNVALEYASGGALSERVKLPENEVRKYTKSVLNGLKFIHGKGFVHCDIKLQNILLFSDNKNDVVKIADFGLAKKSTGELSQLTKGEIRGTPMYMAPETVTGGEQESAADIWAVGCLVSEMITGEPVWKCSEIGALLMKIGNGGEIPEIVGKLSDEGKDFLGKCFLKNPRDRWTAEMLLQHPFVVNSVLCEDTENQISPRDPFDFPDWKSEVSLSVSLRESVEKDGFRSGLPAIPPATRLGQLLTAKEPNWSDSNSWVKVR